MCFIKPLRVKSIVGKTAALEGGIKAYCKKELRVRANDKVLVYGNLILRKL